MHETKRSTTFKTISAVVAACSSLQFGMQLTLPYAIRNITKQHNLDTGLICSIINLFALFGTLICGYVPLNYKYSLLFTNSFFLVGQLLFVFKINNLIMIIARAIIGVGIGFACAFTPGYLSRISPVELRGTLGSLHATFIVLGIFLGSVICYFFDTAANWRYAFFISISFTALQSILLFFIETDVAESNAPTATVKSLLTNKSAKRSILTAVLLHTAMQLSGITPVLFFLGDILETYSNPKLATIFVYFINLVASISTSYIIEKLPRRTLLSTSITVVLISLSLLFMEMWTLAASIIMFIGFPIGLGPIIWMISTEIFPTEFIPPGIVISNSTNWFFAFLVPYLFNKYKDGLQSYVYVPFIGYLCLTLLFTIFVLKETKGKPAAFQ